MNTSARIRAWGRALFVVTVLVGHVIALSDGCRLPEGWGLGGACEWSSVRRDLSLCPDLAGAAAGSEQVRAAGDLQGGSRVGAAPPRPHAHGDGGASARGRPCSDRSARTVDSHVHQRARVYNLRLAGGRQKLTVVSGHGRADAGVDEVPVSSIRLAQRAIVLGCWFLLPLITSPIAVLVKPFREVVWYRLLAMSLGRSGAAFIKWAQWASVRPDMFPQALCDVLSKLTHAAPMHSWDYSQRLLCHAVGGALHTYFDSIDTSAFASGSIAQVYKGYVKGRKVAVKVRHPGVDEQIALDFRIMLAVGQFIDSLPGMGWVNMRASMQQFSHTIASQTRLDIEGNHLDIFNANFRHDRRWCGFPEALLKTESVLVESYQEGFCATSLVLPHSAHAHGIKDHTKEAEPGGRSGGVLAGLWGWVGGLFGGCFGWGGGAEEERIEVEESTGLFIVSKGVDTYLKMLLKDNLMHADLHPGNILLQPGQAERGRRPRIVLVDAGMVAQLSASEQDNFIGLLQALGRGDGTRAAECMLRFSDSQTCKAGQSQEEFKRAMASMFASHCQGYGKQVQVLNVLCLEGLATLLQPTYNILDGARPLLQGYNKLTKNLFPVALMLKRYVDNRTYREAVRKEVSARRQRCPVISSS